MCHPSLNCRIMDTFIFRRMWSILLLCAILFVGCEKPAPNVMRGVQLSAYGVGFAAEGGDNEIVVTPYPDSVKWELDVTAIADWACCEVEGNAISVTAEPNSNVQSRNTSFKIVSPEALFDEIVISVDQEAATTAELRVIAPESYAFDSAASSYTFGVFTNKEWNISADAEWLTATMEPEAQRATISVEANDGDEVREAKVRIEAGNKAYTIAVTQGTHADNPYYRLLGNWEITASKWFYSPNGSLNSLDYVPNPSDYYLIFTLEEVEYGKTLKMRDFLYPGTELEVRYDAETGGIIIPFGWTVLSYDVFFYVTLVSSTQFSYASMEVEATPNDECTTLTLDLPTVDGFNYVGFGLWTYNDNGAKVALGSNYRPTMFPMGDVQFVKKSE